MNYQAIAVSTARLIKKNGKPVVLTQKAAPDLIPETGLIDPIKPPDPTFPGSAVEVQFEQKLIAQSIIKTGSKRLLCIGIPAPNFGRDLLTVDGLDWNIDKVLPLSPGDTVLYYELWVSR